MSESNASPDQGKHTEGVSTSLFEYNSRPPFLKALPLGLQHFLAAIAGIITPPIIVAGTVGASLPPCVPPTSLPLHGLQTEQRDFVDLSNRTLKLLLLGVTHTLLK